MRNKIYREFYHCIIYIANEARHVRIFLFYISEKTFNELDYE